MRQLKYTILDVFAERALEGNPLAVIHDGRGLSDEQMQAIARETNLSETTFVLPTDDPAQDRREGVRVRIFTTREELPFAGHPSLGTATWLHLGFPPLRGASEVTLRLNVGPIRVRLEPRPDPDGGVYATMWQRDPEFSAMHDRAEVAEALGLTEADLMEGAVPQTVSTGNPFCVAGLKLDALKRLALPQERARRWLESNGTRFFYCVAPEADGGLRWRARMQFYGGEDPATGSAAGCAIAWMVRHGWAPSGSDVLVRQGLEIGRPSLLVTRAELHEESVRSITVSGSTVRVADGSFFLPV